MALFLLQNSELGAVSKNTESWNEAREKTDKGIGCKSTRRSFLLMHQLSLLSPGRCPCVQLVGGLLARAVREKASD